MTKIGDEFFAQSAVDYLWIYLLQHLKFTPNNIDIGLFTQPTPAMDDVYKISKDSIVCYRNYYKYGKNSLHSWKNRNPPEWIQC